MSNTFEVHKQVKNDSNSSNTDEHELEGKSKLKVGLIMPISNTEGYPTGHWQDVRRIIEEAVSELDDFEATVSMVSESEDTTLIQKTIVQRIFNDDIVIVDVSSKNPNVMFELGIRLAFDKPFLLLKDNVTDYVFDIHSIHHINYPKDLRYSDVIEVKKKIKSKMLGIYDKSRNEDSMYLKDFGSYKVANLDDKEISLMDYMQKMFTEVKKEIRVGINKRDITVYENQFENEMKEQIRIMLLYNEINHNVLKYCHNNNVEDGSYLYNTDNELWDILSKNSVILSNMKSHSELYSIYQKCLDYRGYHPF